VDRQRQAEVERAHLSGKDAFLATERQTIPIVAKLLSWMAAMLSFGLALSYAKPSQPQDSQAPEKTGRRSH